MGPLWLFVADYLIKELNKRATDNGTGNLHQSF